MLSGLSSRSLKLEGLAKEQYGVAVGGTDPRRTTVGAADTCSSIFSEPNRHHLREFSLLTADVLLEEGLGEGRGMYTRVPSHSSPPVIGNFKRGLKEELEYTAGRDW